jgi:hypothetical protein
MNFSTSTSSVEGRASNIGKAVGCEVIAEVMSTSLFSNPVRFDINPANAQFCPRLSTLALAYERFRIRSLRVRYHPACPATQSGLVGMMIDFDCKDNPPVSPIELAENEASAIGTVSAPLEISATWPTSDQWFLTTPDDAVAAGEPQMRFPATLHVITRDASQAPGDDKKLAGYISIFYVFELLRLKPPVPQVINTNCAAVASSVGVSGQVFVPNLTPTNQVGWWDWLKLQRQAIQVATLGGGPNVVGGAPALTFENSVGVSSGTSVSSSAVVTFGANPSMRFDEDYVDVRPVLRRSDRKSELKSADDPVEEPSSMFWLNPAFDPTIPSVRRPKVHEVTPPRRPLAVNDVVVFLLCARIADGVVSIISSWTQNSAASFLFARAVGIVVADNCRLFFGYEWPTTDTRSVNAGRQTHVTIEEVD